MEYDLLKEIIAVVAGNTGPKGLLRPVLVNHRLRWNPEPGSRVPSLFQHERLNRDVGLLSPFFNEEITAHLVVVAIKQELILPGCRGQKMTQVCRRLTSLGVIPHPPRVHELLSWLFLYRQSPYEGNR